MCVWTIFQLYALYIHRQTSAANATSLTGEPKSHWHQIIALYGALILDFLSMAALATHVVLVDKAGQSWNSKAMYETLALVSIFSMLFVTCLCFIKVQTSNRLRP